jgi:hypothetical protein
LLKYILFANRSYFNISKKKKKKNKKNKNFLQEYKQKLTVHYGDMYQSSCLELNYLIKLNHWESLVQ